MTTTELIKLLQENEIGGITHNPRKIRVRINRKFMPDPEIIISDTGDGMLGPEICLDIDGEFYEWQGDNISRQDALLCCTRGEYPFDSPQGEENSRIESELRRLPPAPKQKTGYWIKVPDEDRDEPYPVKWYKCSECGREICEPTPKFCDECGTKIIGIKDEAKK